MTSKENFSSPKGSEKSSNKTEKSKTKEKFGDSFDVNFKPIHQQIQEENEKKQQIVNQGSKKSLFPNIEIDEKLLNLLMPSETFNEDDFDYFQHFGTKRFESSHTGYDLTQEDIKKFRNLKSKVIIKEESKMPKVFLAKEHHKEDIKKLNIIKITTKSNDEVLKEKEENFREKSLKKEKAHITLNTLVNYSSEDEPLGNEIYKKIKVDHLTSK